MGARITTARVGVLGGIAAGVARPREVGDFRVAAAGVVRRQGVHDLEVRLQVYYGYLRCALTV